MKNLFAPQTRRWTRPIIAILFPCLLFFLLSNLYILSQLQKSAKENNTYLNSIVQSSIDKRLEEIYRYTLSLELNSENTALKNAEVMPTSIPDSIYRFQDIMRDYVISNTLVAGIYIYYPQIDFVVGNLGCFKADSYRMLHRIYMDGSEKDWKNLITSQPRNFFLLDGTKENPILCYVSPRRIGGICKSVTVVEIDSSALLSVFSQVQNKYPDLSTLSILLDGKVIAIEGDAVDTSSVEELYEKWEQNKSSVMQLSGTETFFSDSVLEGLHYASFYQESSAMKTVKTTAGVCAVGVLASFIVVILGSSYITRYNMKPIQNMIEKFGVEKITVDSYEFLDQQIENLLREHSKNQKKIFEHQMILDSIFLATALRGELRNESSAFAAANRYGVIFDGTSFQVLVISNADRTVPDDDVWRKSLYEMLMQQQLEGLVTAYNGRLCVLLNSEGNISESTLRHLCVMIMDSLFPDEPAVAGIGNCYDSMASIVTSYQCARRALLACTPSVEHPVYVYTSEMSQGHHGDNRVMQFFSRQIYQKEYAQARKTLEQLCEEYLRTSVASSSDGIRQSAVTNLILDAASETLPDDQVYEISKVLSFPMNLSDYQRIMYEILGRLERAQIENAGEDTKPSVAVSAKEIIDKNFTDPMMGLYFVGERLNVNNSYLATTFKNTYQISVAQYINKCRIEHAKHLLVSTSMNVKDVARLVGFSSDISFIRVFKKQENKTPTVFRTESGN